MSTHTGSTFFHSCLKVPIDPCNNCPAPTYNRPSNYLGRQGDSSKKPVVPLSMDSVVLKTHSTKISAEGATETDETTTWINKGIRSLAKLYDSIPDYCDINHLPESEFYSTLDTLRSKCHQLKSKAATSVSTSTKITVINQPNARTDGSSASSTVTSAKPCSHRKASKKKSGKGPKKKSPPEDELKSKKPTKKESNLKQIMSPPPVSSTVGLYDNLIATRVHLKKPPTPWQQRLHHHLKIEEHCFREEVPSSDYGTYNTTEYKKTSDTKPKSLKEDYEAEVESFKRTLKEFEEEIKKRPVSSTSSSCLNATLADAKNNEKSPSISTQTEENPCPTKPEPSVSLFRKSMRKAFSVNDIDALSDLGKQSQNDTQGKRLGLLPKAEAAAFEDHRRPSNYFEKKIVEQKEGLCPCIGLPRIIVESPNTEATSSTNHTSRSNGKRKKKARKKDHTQMKAPFTIFNLVSDRSKNENDSSEPGATPVHPVARPNLAATLRVEVSRKKLKELKNNCTYHDTTPHFDWEVRKTPAWKSLSLNESHKEILALRLETRRAEQALQQREYELNMELMRQRVKSAPLLLEGATYWGPTVGKLTHNCQREGSFHSCHQSLQLKPRRKSAGSKREAHSECRSANRLNAIRKIYASSAKCSSRSRSSSMACQRTDSQQSRAAREAQEAAQFRKHNSTLMLGQRRSARKTHEDQQCDSGDELCSVDRAFL